MTRAPRSVVTACGHGCRPRTWLWMAAAGARPRDHAFFARQPRRVGDERVVLRRLGSRARRERVDDRQDEPGAQLREVALDVLAGLVRADRAPCPREDAAGVERLHDAHDRHAGLGVAGHHGPVDRRRAAPSRQQRRVHVDQAQPRAWRGRRRAGSCRRPRPRRGRAPVPRARRGTPRPSAGPAGGRGRPCSSANTFTGPGLGFCPRPRGRSGCVTTATTSWPAARSVPQRRDGELGRAEEDDAQWAHATTRRPCASAS